MAVPSISVVVPTYNVAKYMPAFLGSLDEQTADLSAVEFIFVNDGATDESATIIEGWLDRRRDDIDGRLLNQANGGLAAARNAGLDAALGDWVTFCDPDDQLGPGYFKELLAFLATPQASTVHVVVGNLVYLDDETGKVSNRHPLRARFAEGTRIIDMERHPQFVHVGANHALFRRAILNRYGLRYDSRVRPVWEDGHVTSRYLGKFERPRMAVIAEARYLYRRRSDGTSLMQGAWTSREKYTDVLRYGWLDSLRTVTADRGRTPHWLQNMILYDLFGYFQRDRQSPSPVAALPREITEEFYALLEEILPYIDVAAIEDFRVSVVPHEIKRAIVMGLKGVDRRPTEIAIDRIDVARNLARLNYYYAGERPVEELRARGFRVAPVHEKVRSSIFLGRRLMYERVIWLPANGTLAVKLDGEPVPLRPGPIVEHAYSIGPTAIWRALLDQPPPRKSAPVRTGLRPRAGRIRRDVNRRVKAHRGTQGQRRRDVNRTVRAATTPWAKRRFRNAWLLIDRDSQANDNAEHMYRYLREHQPSVNAFFVLSRQSSDWDRLAREGFRLIEHGSREHRVALLNCAHLLSSQIDNYIVKPLHPRYGEGHWYYTFLQHGVILHDLSIWLNPKAIDLMLTTTPDERESIVGEATNYLHSTHEVKLTGLPRHDRLLTLAAQRAGQPNKLILVAPTWRRTLLRDQLAGGNDRELREDFWESDYAVQWRAVLESERLHEALSAEGWQIAFVPHPNMQRYLDDNPLPPHVRVHRFSDIDIQELMAGAGVMITDYSSIAFDVAYLERPIVYFQFDQDVFFKGGHPFRLGDWEYAKQGFGPVVTEPEAAVDALVSIVERGGAAEPEYARRMAETFPFRDGECSRRAYEAILEISRPLTYDELYLRLDPLEVLAGVPVEPGPAEPGPAERRAITR